MPEVVMFFSFLDIKNYKTSGDIFCQKSNLNSSVKVNVHLKTDCSSIY